MSNSDAAPTLEDVARTAGVSTATVSRCLNAPDRVAKSTRDRVLNAVEALGYTPNFAARVMAARRSFAIGAIIPTMENAIFARGVQAFQEELHARGYTLLVSSSAYQPEVEKEQIQTLVSRGADGLLLIGHDRDSAIYEGLARRRVPVVVAWSYQAEAAVPSVGFDNRAAMSALAQEVIALGHRRLGMISGISAGNDRARLRIEGLRDAMVRNGLDPADLSLIETPYGMDGGAAAFDRLMAQDSRPSAVMCGNDVLAAGALNEALNRGMAVPEEVSITGFDDIELAGILRPGLSTVHVPHRDMGRQAAQVLVDMVEGRGAGRSIRLPTEVIRRGSLAKRPQ